MAIAVFAFPVSGLLACLFIAVRPQHMETHVQRVRSAWGVANTLEKIGLVFMCIPVPGPFDECVGFVFIGLGRIQRLICGRKALRDFQRQVDEDTCEQHNVFCCPDCFDMRPVRSISV